MLKIIFILSLIFSPAIAQEKHGLTIFGDLKYPSDFTHFEYVNPDAPKGGEIVFASIGTYDNLNPYILKGISASGLELIYDTLLVKSADEPFSAYGLIAKSVEVAEDKSWVKFTLREKAKWHDGTPITADDVIFSLNILKKEGHPFYRTYYGDVKEVKKISPHKVVFNFSVKNNRELPLIIGEMPILPAHYYKENEFNKTTLTPPLGSGNYKISKVDGGRSITYERVKDYWGKDLAVKKGRYNFDKIRYDYYRDATVAVEALKAGEYDLRQENISRVWATAYNFEGLRNGTFIKKEIYHQIPSGMQGFVFNTRRDKFKDIRVRKALNYTFDFEWANKTLFYSAYKRTKNYFSNSIYESSGLPNGKELEILSEYACDNCGRGVACYAHKKQGFSTLNPYTEKTNKTSCLPPHIFAEEYKVPSTDGSGWARDNLIKAKNLLEEAGYKVKNQMLVDENEKPFTIEFLLHSASFKRVVAPMVRNLKKLGINSNIRIVDSSQYVERIKKFDFDMLVYVFPSSLAPGNELIDYWHSNSADVAGTNNISGVKNKIVDDLIDRIIKAKNKDEYIALLKALDRVLLWEYLVVPNWYNQSFRMIYWDKFGYPEISPKYSRGIIDTWWIK